MLRIPTATGTLVPVIPIIVSDGGSKLHPNEMTVIWIAKRENVHICKIDV